MGSLRECYGIPEDDNDLHGFMLNRTGHVKRSQVMIREGLEVYSRRYCSKRRLAVGKIPVQGDFLLKTRQVRRLRRNHRNGKSKYDLKISNSNRIRTKELYFDRSIKELWINNNE